MTGKFCRPGARGRRSCRVSFAVAVETEATVSAVHADDVGKIPRLAGRFRLAQSLGRYLTEFSATVGGVLPVLVQQTFAGAALLGPALLALVGRQSVDPSAGEPFSAERGRRSRLSTATRGRQRR